ncbi:DUF6541 family protein [Halomarina litorea]|uniref:DUF6541 family protein n=1 Tax=Halomarina litorea TaxID=2961595 RepID=UPI0020C3EB26|nr:DUF6541 family protein [Halomarina sp. BCD28]
MTERPGGRHRRSKGALTVGFLAVAVAILLAWSSPAGQYELSIYGATPAPVWAALSVALLVSILVGSSGREGYAMPLAAVLAVAAMMTVVGLPIIRNYHAYGLADALTHMGWAKGIAFGEMSTLGILYPGSHIATSLVSAVTGVYIGRAMMFVVALFVLAYLVFVPLTVRTLVGDGAATVIATFSGLFLLPITNVSTFLDYHPYTLATFLFPLLLFLVFKYLADRPRQSRLGDVLSSTGLVLVVVGVTVNLVHPQVAVNMLVLLGAIVAAQWLYRWLPGGDPLSENRSLLAPTLFLGAFFLVWTLRYEIVFNMLFRLVEQFQLFLDGGAGAGAVVKAREESADGLGVSIVELFGKLFFVHAAYVLLSAGLVLVALAGRLTDDRPDRNAAVAYVTYGGLALTPFFLLHFLGDVSGYFFRHVGFGMMLMTILGALALHALQRWAVATDVARWVRPIAVVALAAALVLSVLVMFPSPYIYKPTHHVTEASMSGHELSFESGDLDDVRYTGLEPSPERFADGLRTDIRSYDTVPPAYLRANNLTEYTGDDPYYYTVTRHNYGVEVVSHKGHEYTRRMFANIGTEFGVDRVQANGDLTVYYVDSAVTTPPPDESSRSQARDGRPFALSTGTPSRVR